LYPLHSGTGENQCAAWGRFPSVNLVAFSAPAPSWRGIQSAQARTRVSGLTGKGSQRELRPSGVEGALREPKGFGPWRHLRLSSSAENELLGTAMRNDFAATDRAETGHVAQSRGQRRYQHLVRTDPVRGAPMVKIARHLAGRKQFPRKPPRELPARCEICIYLDDSHNEFITT